ncbi:MAG: CPXCG motif-containing cysteine-rich protein [Gemmatimonadota bacterium]
MPAEKRPSADAEPRYPGPRDVLDEVQDRDLGAPAPTVPGRTTNSSTLSCPYCGEKNELFLEPDQGRGAQEFIEECETCGRTYALTVDYDADGEPSIHAERTD